MNLWVANIGQIASFDSMVPMVPFMLNGTYNPGQLQIVRELLTAPGPDFDTAVFTGNLADYTFKVNGIDIVGAPLNTVAGDIVTVTDSVTARDGSDRLTNIERLQFADQSVVLSGLNAAPVGALMLSDFTPAVGQVLTVSSANVSDANNTATGGAITGGMSYFWQAELAVGTGIFSNIIRINEGGQSVRAEGQSFTVTPDLNGLALRVMAIYKDANNVLETVFSTPTALVAPNAAHRAGLAASESAGGQGAGEGELEDDV